MTSVLQKNSAKAQRNLAAQAHLVYKLKAIRAS